MANPQIGGHAVSVGHSESMRFLVLGATHGRGDGIGHAAALALVARGHRVHGLCRDAAKASAEKVFPLEALDLASLDGQARLKALVRELDPDVIWSAIGAGIATPLWAMDDTAVETLLDANVRQAVLLCRACAPSCIDGGPHLVLTGSVAGVIDGTGAALYSGVKGFLVPFLRAQRVELRRQGHHPKLSLLMLDSIRATGLELVVEALEFVGRQSHSIELLVA